MNTQKETAFAVSFFLTDVVNLYIETMFTFGMINMKKLIILFTLLLSMSLFSSCASSADRGQIATTTLPVYEFTTALCKGTGISVTRLVTEDVSCLHDYTLQVSQMQAIASAQVIVLSGAGLEKFLEDALSEANMLIDASNDISLLDYDDHHNHEEHNHNHHHEQDPHIWLSPVNAKKMCQNISHGLIALYPQHKDLFLENLDSLLVQLNALQDYGAHTLENLSTRELVTFHDGFAYLAQSFDLHILETVEEESGSEASAKELIELTELIRTLQIPSIFVERSGSTSAAEILYRETGAEVFVLDMAMAGDSYFDAMYHNINTLKEALG